MSTDLVQVPPIIHCRHIVVFQPFECDRDGDDVSLRLFHLSKLDIWESPIVIKLAHVTQV